MYIADILYFEGEDYMSYIPNFKFALREDLLMSKNFLPIRRECKGPGWDVFAAVGDNKLVIKPGEYFRIPLGFGCLPETGWWYELHARHSFFLNKNIHHMIGVMDEDYDQEVMLGGQYMPSVTDLRMSDLVISHGDLVGRMIPFKRVEMKVEEISNFEFDQFRRQKMRQS